MKAKELWLKFLSCGSIKGTAFFLVVSSHTAGPLLACWWICCK